MSYIVNMRIDLQIHSLYSDGYLSPRKLAVLLHRYQIKAASLTDHNNITGQEEFKRACQKYKIKAVLGLELYVRYRNWKFNLLWYNYNLDSKDLQKLLEETWQRRRRSVERVMSHLRHQGFRLDLKKFFARHPAYIPTNHLADAIMAVPGNLKILRETLKKKEIQEHDVIRTCLYPPEGMRLEEARVSLTKILKLRRQIGGQLLFCHPGLHDKFRGELLESVLDAGVDGIELLSPHHGYNTMMHLNNLANRRRVITSGGSDFHRPGMQGSRLRYAWDWFVIDSDSLPGVGKIIGG